MPQCVGLSCRFSGRATIRGELALKRKHIIAAKAKENQKRSGGAVPQKSAEPVETRKELAKIAGVSHDTIARVHGSGRCQAIPTHRLCAPPVLTHDHPGDTGREKMPSVENAVGRVQGSGPPHYSGIRFGIRFRVPIRSHPINIAESPEYGRPPPVGWSPNRVRSGRLPIRSHPINPIMSSPAGGVLRYASVCVGMVHL